MEAKIKFKERHDAANLKLKSIALPKIEKIGLKPVTELIAANLDISSQTVVNYVYERGKDGFLTEAITQQFKKIKS